MAKQLMPRAALVPRANDVPWTADQCLKLTLFASVRRKPSLDRYPGAVVLRRYRAGEVICRQGEAGWTAFYILTQEDVLEVLRFQLWAARDEGFKRDMIQAIAQQYQHVRRTKELPPAHELRQAATVHLAGGRRQPVAKSGNWLQQLRRRWLSGLRAPREARPLFIPFDGPTEIDYDSRQATMYEGELFGEMSCLNRTPRSATVVATRDCYVLEMLRNILDQLLKDPPFKARLDETYRVRVMQLHLRQLALLSDLSDDQIADIRKEVELVAFEPGQLLCDEHERSDFLYIIRRGLVKVQRGASALLGPDHVLSWPSLCTALRAAAQESSGPPAVVWRLLSEKARTAAHHPEPDRMDEPDRAELRQALNELIKNRELPDQRALQGAVLSVDLRQQAGNLTQNSHDWSDQEARKFNRLLLEAVLPGVLRPYQHQAGRDAILAYCSRGDFIGEVGLLDRQPRSATCVAYGQRVEALRIPEALLRDLMDLSGDIRRKLLQEKARREQRTSAQVRLRVWEDEGNALYSKDAERLGLVEGQKLMVIDLNACTRCDECVRACVDTHADGRSRLFLDGPRFGHYLVPTTCRSCLDPVCMVGCPVGAIHRGDNGQITIEDWCIGCELCAKQCPYGAIQMHDVGIIPENAREWRYLPAAVVGDAPWYRPRFRDHDWARGSAPFRLDREFQAAVGRHRMREGQPAVDGEVGDLCFRYTFDLAADLFAANSLLKLHVTSLAAAVTVWINGQEVQADKPRGGKREYWLPLGEPIPVPPPEPPAPGNNAPASAETPAPAAKLVAAANLLRAGRNVLAVRVTPAAAPGELLLQARLDEVRRPDVAANLAEEITQMLVTHRAVVCDLCSTLPKQTPACVQACPHDAALRIDARFEMPVRLNPVT
jgi:CRP-like cAMP-binding protein/Fe-S-cluster-containing hydrogenase component 2